jgi:hypothetical protein
MEFFLLITGIYEDFGILLEGSTDIKQSNILKTIVTECSEVLTNIAVEKLFSAVLTAKLVRLVNMNST